MQWTEWNVTKLRLFLCYRGVSVLPCNALLSQIFEDRKSAKWVLGAEERRRDEVEGETDYSPVTSFQSNFRLILVAFGTVKK